tara:strand:- start:1065 stop:2075 length:1011 start_codon:yes stop_codon:yes gene_type:complete
MATNYPGSLDTSTQQPSPSSTTDLDAAGYLHDVVHTNHSGALIALETKLGSTDSNPVADAVLMGTGSGTSAWDTSPTFKGAVTVGVDDTGHDVKFFGAATGKYMLWDESDDRLIVSGKVGIGTTAPETDLHITNASTLARVHLAGSSTGYTQSDVRLDTSDSHRGAGVYAFNSDSDVTWFWGNVYNAGDTWGVCRKTGSSMQQSAADSGSLLFQIGSNGAAYNATGTYGTISDERLKSDITTARQYTADLAKLRVVNYSLTQRAEMNEDTGEVEIIALEEPSGKLLGLVAQEVEKVFPAMVETRSDGIKSVKTSVLVPMMLTAIQELTTRVAALEG